MNLSSSLLECQKDDGGEAKYGVCSWISECVVSLRGEINSIAAMQGCNKHGRVYARELRSLQERIGEAWAQGEGKDAHMWGPQSFLKGEAFALRSSHEMMRVWMGAGQGKGRKGGAFWKYWLVEQEGALSPRRTDGRRMWTKQATGTVT